MHRRPLDPARYLTVMARRGLIHPHRPDVTLRQLRAARRAGPFAAMLVPGTARAPDTAAVVDDGGPLTFAELDGRSNALARGLTAAGVEAGEVVGLLGRNHSGLVLGLVAAAKLGARIACLNTGFGAPQLADVVRREHVGTLLVDDELEPLTRTLDSAVRRVRTDGAHGGVVPTVDELMTGRSPASLPLPTRPGGMILLTSGTTGAPKGAVRDRMSPFQSAQILDRLPLPRRGAMVLSAPLFHGTGLQQFVIALALTKTVVLGPRRFDAEAALAAIAAHRADTLVLVPTMLQRILDLPAAVHGRHDTSSLTTIACGGSALAPDLCRRTAERYGPVLHNIYGSTEVAIAAVATPADLHRAPGTVGRPPVGCRVALYDERRRPVTASDVPGTIFVGNGLRFAGYSDGSAREVVDGLVSTGDVGHVDDGGLLFVDGRADDMIVSGGENVFPQEVEQLLAERPEIAEVAVVGVNDAEFGQRLRAFVVPHPGATSDAQALRDHVRADLARHKVPRDVVFVDRLPRNALGKVLRQELRELL